MNSYIDIITVSKNSRQKLEETLISLDGIAGKKINHILIDACSNDGTQEIIEKWKKNIGKIIIEKDHGIYDAMNKGINISKNRWVVFLNAGDVLTADGCNFMSRPIIGDDRIIAFGYKIINNGKSYMPRNYLGFKLPTSHNALIYPSKWLKKTPFDLGYKVASDFDQFLKLSKILKTEKNRINLIETGNDGYVSSRKMQSYEEYSKILKSNNNFIGEYLWKMKIYLKKVYLLR